jgi:hypothetical protein
MIALIHPKGVSAGFLAFVLVATVILVGMAWYTVRNK